MILSNCGRRLKVYNHKPLFTNQNIRHVNVHFLNLVHHRGLVDQGSYRILDHLWRHRGARVREELKGHAAGVVRVHFVTLCFAECVQSRIAHDFLAALDDLADHDSLVHFGGLGVEDTIQHPEKTIVWHRSERF